MGLVHGVGVYEKGEYVAWIDGKHTREYRLWKNMIKRCYSKKELNLRASYIGCEVSKNFLNFQYFANWCQSQIGFSVKEYQLDKDVVFKGNKLYSEDTCFFVPRRVNMFLTKRDKLRGVHPIGVSFDKNLNKFRSQSNTSKENIIISEYMQHLKKPSKYIKHLKKL